MVRGARRLFGLAAGLLLLACACDPEATPLPVNLPTRPPPTEIAATDEAPQVLRYAVAPDALPYLSAADQAQIAASASLIPLDAPPAAADLGAQYDIVVSLTALPDFTAAPEPLQVSLIFDTSLPPLDDPDIELIIHQSVDPQAIAAAPTPSQSALRSRLANAGYPDGFDLTLLALAPGADTLAALLESVGIHARLVSDSAQPAHLTLTTAPNGDALTILTLPLYYRAVDGLSITFTPSGFPVAQR